MKHLRNTTPGDQWWTLNVEAERRKWHPQAVSAPTLSTHAVASAAAPLASATASAPTPAPWARASTPPPSLPIRTAEPTLPPGWSAANDGRGNVYYYHTETRVTQWDRPTEHQGPPSLPPSLSEEL